MKVQVYNMSCCSKEKMERYDYNKSHSAKSDREMYRICPSKLSKKELEDLYFTLLENNLELKKTINGQQDKIRVLSTQVQRMTNTHDKMMSKEMKESSTGTKAFVDEQNDFITELKETNRRMAERLHQLNMRLCSAKQFAKTTPPLTSNSKRFRSAIASPPKKHNCLTKDQDNEQGTKLSTSSQWEDKTPRETAQTEIMVPHRKTPRETAQTEIMVPHRKTPRETAQTEIMVPHRKTPRETAQTEIMVPHRKTPRDPAQTEIMVPHRQRSPKSDQPCDENKCRFLMEQLKVKIVSLQDELFNVHEEYSTRISRLETEVSEVRKENIRVCSEHSASEHELQNTVKRTSDLLAQYRLSEAKCSELTAELAIEKRKVAELETHLKAANMSDKVNKTIEEHLTTIQETNGAPDDGLLKCHCGCPTPHIPPRVMNEKAPIKSFPLLSPPKGRDREGPSVTTKYNPSKGSLSTVTRSHSQLLSKSSPTKTVSEEMNCDTCGCKPQLTSDPVPVVIPTSGDEMNCDTCGCKPQLTSDPVPVPSPTSGDEMNCDTCGCKSQLTSDPVHRPASAENCKCRECVCPLPQDLSPQAKNTQCDFCGCANLKNTSTPRKAKKKNVECCCPVWVKSGILKPAAQSQDEHAKCIKCCFKYEDGATDSPPSKNGKFLSPRGATTPPSPRKEKDGTKPSKTGDDSGYQDTDELVLIKQNSELMTKILELQNQVDLLKIQMCEMSSEAKPGKVSISTGSANKTRDYAAVATAAAPLLGELTKASELPEAVPASLPSAVNATATSSSSRRLHREFSQAKIGEERIEHNKPIEGGNNKPAKQVPFPHMVSEERVREPGKILSIEILGNPKEPVRMRNWDDTRAKTIKNADGTIKISEEPSSDKFSPLDLMNDDYQEHNKTDSPKLKIKEKKKLEIPGSSKPESANVSLKSPTSDISGPGFNPELLKYLEAEGIVAQPELGDSSKLKEDSSLTESVPSNPELGFGIPRLASKASQNKAESDSGQAKKPPVRGPGPQQARDDLVEVLQGKLKLPMTEALVANHPTAPKQTDETNTKKEDCENCAACSFDKECELKHENATKNKMNTLAPGMQKEQAKKHDQHNSLQIPGPIPPSESNKKEKMRHLFSHFMKDRTSKQKKEGFVINPKIYRQQTTATTDELSNLLDVPLLDKKQLGADYIKIDKKKLTHDKTDRSIKEKKGTLNKEELIVDSNIYAQQTGSTTDGPISLPDVPFLDKSVDSKDDVERKPSRIVFSVDNNLGPPLLEVKMPTHRTHSISERMLPTLLAPANVRGKATHVEGKADVVQSTDPKLAEKSCQVPTNIAWLCHSESCRPREVSLYRRRSGSLCYRALSAAAPLACSCPGQQDGYCSDKPREKSIQAHDKEEVKSPRDQRRALLTSTYTLSSKQTSPDNTELEMSDLSDLPMEKEKKTTFKSRSLSPGEDKTTTFTTTHSYYSPPPSLLSEGEMPATIGKRKISEPDIVRPYLNPTLAHKLETPPSQQMEVALHAISDELRRCRSMLRAPRPAQQSECASQTSPPEATPPIALRPGVATQGIGDTYAPMSIFTLHIGTIVWSDEAVVNSRDKNLVLKWKFYDQAVTMARMHAGRVVVFDFSTEYDIKVTEDFLHYLKHEEMPIVICELDKEEEPFASCVLPLRDALLHTNTRADMSLALMAGPQMLNERTTAGPPAAPGAGGEVGVIDLWCLMRADANMLPGINLAIAQPGAATESRHSRVMPQVLHDYNELDLAVGSATRAAPLKSTGKNETYGSVEYNRTSNTWSYSRSGRAKQATGSDSSRTISYDPSKYPPIRERKYSAPASSPSVPPKRYDAAQEKQPQSELIINEVNPKIKAPGDIRHAVERSNRLNDSRSRSNRSEDQFSQAHSSYGSLRSVLSRLQKRGSRFTQTHGGDQRSFLEKLRKANTNKAEQSKKVTIMPKYTDAEIESSPDASEDPPQIENQKRNMPKLEITVLWLALNEECEAMIDPRVQRVYVAYTFLGRSGADLETPVSLPKPKHYVDKCYFNFNKVFELSNSDLLKLGHMARCRAGSPVIENEKDCIIFSVVSEPADDPLGIESCEDIGYAYLYLGDLVAYSAGSPGYTEVVPVRAARGPDYVCGVLAVRLDGLDVVRRCLLLTPEETAGHST